MDTFYLSTETLLQLHRVGRAPDERWMQVPCSGLVRPAFVMVAGEHVDLADALTPSPDSRLLLRYGAAHPHLGRKGASIRLEFVSTEGAQLLAELAVPHGATGLAPRQAVLDLSACAGLTGNLRLSVPSSAGRDGHNDWLALYELAVAHEDALGCVRARAFHRERAENELAHFAHVYDHGMYQNEATPTARVARCRLLGELVLRAPQDATPALMVDAPAPEDLPKALRDPYHYSHFLLGRELRAKAPDFGARLRDLAARKPLRVLSLCSGAARIEAGFAAAADGADIRWTLMDLNEPLLQSAAAAFPAAHSPELIVGNLNQIADFGERFDVILCVSGLHHIVELESVVSFIRNALVEDGEFWSIGEAIGRNGNRLWGQDYAVANGFFRNLPPRLRRNRATGKVDTDLPNVDYSASTFEGIRSQDIEAVLMRQLDPVHLYRRNCFLWRLADLAYADNYVMDNPEDISWLHRAVAAELTHFRGGGRPTELHAIFRRPAD